MALDCALKNQGVSSGESRHKLLLCCENGWRKFIGLPNRTRAGTYTSMWGWI